MQCKIMWNIWKILCNASQKGGRAHARMSCVFDSITFPDAASGSKITTNAIIHLRIISFARMHLRLVLVLQQPALAKACLNKAPNQHARPYTPHNHWQAALRAMLADHEGGHQGQRLPDAGQALLPHAQCKRGRTCYMDENHHGGTLHKLQAIAQPCATQIQKE